MANPEINKVKINQVIIDEHTITYHYEVTGEWENAFTQKRCFEVTYSCALTGLPEGVAVVPFLANLLPMAWVYDAEIIVSNCDEAFYNSVEAFKQGYREMYPMLQFRGKLTAEHLQENVLDTSHGCAAFFSGGVDAFSTLTQHADEKPTLLTLWGADVKLDDFAGWKNVEEHLKQTAKDFNVDYVTIRSEFRMFNNDSVLAKKVSKSGDNWWHGFQHGIGIISHAAPAMYILGLKTVFFASSFTAADRGKVTCASDPTIDNNVKFCGCNVVHDGYEFTRQMKVHNITQFSKNTGKHIHLRVCWESSGGSNCCNCEKCWRTILGIYAEGFNPRDFGFEYESIESVFSNIRKNKELLKWHKESRYAPMQAILRQNYSIDTVNKELCWFFEVPIERLGEVPIWKKAWRFTMRCGRKIKRMIKG